MKRRIFIVIGILILGVGAFLVYRYFNIPSTKEFYGNLQSINGSSIFVKGAPFSSDAKVAQSIKIDTTNLPTVEIVATSATKITRITFKMPTAAELKKTNGMFEPAKLPREQSVVGIDTLENDFKTAKYTIGMHIISGTNVIDRQKFTAKEIEYTFPVQ